MSRLNPLGKNQKTLRSLDLSTICPKRRAGKPCAYCYVEAYRRIGVNAKKLHDRIPYRRNILKLAKWTIDKLNRSGGLRLFSFGDYMPWMDKELFMVIEDARKVGLMLKAITKQEEFVHKFWRYMSVINVSIDSIGCGVDHDRARMLRDMYPNVKVRAVILSHEDLENLSWADILTLNHGPNGFYHFKKSEMPGIIVKYGHKLCCLTGKCETCQLRCGWEGVQDGVMGIAA